MGTIPDTNAKPPVRSAHAVSGSVEGTIVTLRSISTPHIGVRAVHAGDQPEDAKRSAARLFSALVGGFGEVSPTVLFTDGTTVGGGRSVMLRDIDLTSIETIRNGIRIKIPSPLSDMIGQALGWLGVGVPAGDIANAIARAGGAQAFVADFNGDLLRVAMRPMSGRGTADILDSAVILNRQWARPLILAVMDGKDVEPSSVRDHRAVKGFVFMRPDVFAEHPLLASAGLEPDVTLDEANTTIEVMNASGAGLDLLFSPGQIDDDLAWRTVAMIKDSPVDRRRYDQASGVAAVIAAEITRIDAGAAARFTEALGGSRPLPDPWTEMEPLAIDIAGAGPWKTALCIGMLSEHAAVGAGTIRYIAFDRTVMTVPPRPTLRAVIDLLRTGRKRDLYAIFDLEAGGQAMMTSSGGDPALASMLGGIFAMRDGRMLLASGASMMDLTGCVRSEDIAAGDALRTGGWPKGQRA